MQYLGWADVISLTYYIMEITPAKWYSCISPNVHDTDVTFCSQVSFMLSIAASSPPAFVGIHEYRCTGVHVIALKDLRDILLGLLGHSEWRHVCKEKERSNLK